MIDKPKGKIEHFIEDAMKWFHELADEFKEIFDAGKEEARAHRNAHPRIARAASATVMLCACGLIIVGFATPKTVIVKIDDSRKVSTTVYETTSTRVDSFIEITA